MSAKLLLNADLHSPDDFLTEELGAEILAGAGLDHEEVGRVMVENPGELFGLIGR